MKSLDKVLGVRYATGKRLQHIPLDTVYDVEISENLHREPLHLTHSSVIVRCIVKGTILTFTYSQFSEPECFDVICERYGLESALDPDERDNFTVRRQQSAKDQAQRIHVLEPAKTDDPLAKEVEAASPVEKRKLLSFLQRWLATTQG